MQSTTRRPATSGVPVITNSMGTSLFTELKASSSNEPNLELLDHDTTKEFGTFAATTWGFTSAAGFTTDTTPTAYDVITTKPTSNTTTLKTSSAQTTISINTLTTTSQNISNETRPLTNTSNQFHVDVHVEQLVIPGHTNATHPKPGHKCIDDSSKSTEKLPKDGKGHSKSTKIWITVGVFSGWLKNDIELLYFGLMRYHL